MNVSGKNTIYFSLWIEGNHALTTEGISYPLLGSDTRKMCFGEDDIKEELCMTHEDFREAIDFWNKKDTVCMPQELLKKAVEAYILANNTCALATGTGDYVRCTPIEYSYHDEKFWMFSEGGEKFIGLEKNENVSLAVFDKYNGFGTLKSIQVMGKAEIIEPFSDVYNKHAEYKKIPLAVLKKMNSPMYLICVRPIKIQVLFSDFKQDGYDSRQTLDFLDEIEKI